MLRHLLKWIELFDWKQAIPKTELTIVIVIYVLILLDVPLMVESIILGDISCRNLSTLKLG